ncbi:MULTISPECIES: S8 family serine peptidase [Haloferax]|uniref:S8 family serine peptidase n=2 Tax=Haloferax TaxID=2251 RepID=A0A6G1YZ50_9EURY|nr:MULTISPECIES: S8 family serine peptidase [Haloferax]KAB1186702.1 S8 family serine peptidase [Haloferax sp. CBA1149]MRW79324.1 S8 family serine peptidase [Haloferax marinisediminis]
MTDYTTISRRQLLRITGASIALGGVGTGVAGAEEGRYIVGVNSNAGLREARRRAASVKRVLDFGGIGTAVAGQFSQSALRGLSNRPDVRYIEPDGVMHAIGGPSDIDSSDAEIPWGVDRVDAEKVHESTTGDGAHIAIIDSGIDNDHPDLSGNLGDGIAYTVGPRWRDDSSTDPRDWDDGNGHGTHCAGIAAAVNNGNGVVGVSTRSTLHAVKVLDNSGSGSYSDVAAGIAYVADRGWDVGSLSLGGGLSSTIEDACNYAYGKGVLLVAAAGNDGEDVANSAPAAYPSVVAVSATSDDDSVPSWSNFGDEIELAAPGVNIYSTYKGGGYATLSGTSMACPHVSGAAGLLMSTGLSHTDARTRLQSSAEDIGASGRDTYYGYGLLDVEAALGGASDGGSGDDGSSDTTAPSAPSNLTSPTQTDTTVDLSWDASTDDTGVAYYTVYVGSTAWGTTTETSETVTGLAADTSYDCFVTATDAAGNESAQSNTITVTTNTAGGTPPTVTSFSVQSGSPNNPHADVELSWRVSGSPESVALELYDGSISSGESPIQTWSVASEGSLVYQEKFASPKAYTARIVATNAAGTDEETKTVQA